MKNGQPKPLPDSLLEQTALHVHAHRDYELLGLLGENHQGKNWEYLLDEIAETISASYEGLPPEACETCEDWGRS